MNQMEKPFDKHDYALGQIPNVFCFSWGEKIRSKFKIQILQMTTGQWNVRLMMYKLDVWTPIRSVSFCFKR